MLLACVRSFEGAAVLGVLLVGSLLCTSRRVARYLRCRHRRLRRTGPTLRDAARAQ